MFAAQLEGSLFHQVQVGPLIILEVVARVNLNRLPFGLAL